MTSDPGRLGEVERHPDHDAAVPTPEHFLPLAYLAGLCRAAGEPAVPFVEGGSMGSLTMTSYVLGALPHAQVRGSNAGAANLPDPAVVPPQQTNM
jgi:4,5-DOPA dioxygenase extradiol